MTRIIVKYDETAIKESKCEILQRIPDGAAVTITENCGGCDWCVMACAGNKPACGHPKILAERPYADDPTINKLSRRVDLEDRPKWCKL